MHDPYSRINPPPMPGAPGGLRYALSNAAGTNFLLLLPPCDHRLVDKRRVMVSVSGGEYVRYRAGSRDTYIRLALAEGDMVAAYVIDVNASGQPSARGGTATFEATLPEISGGSRISSENGPPDDAYGDNDDVWIDLVTGNMYKKANGTWY